MIRKRWVLAAVVLLAFALFTTMARAAEEKVDLKGEAWKQAKGQAIIKDAGEGQKEITIEAKGLRPDSVYTLWVVNPAPRMDMAGVGTGDYSFKSDSNGNATYKAAIPAEELEKWKELEVAYHPDGDPANMKNHQTALKGDLKG